MSNETRNPLPAETGEFDAARADEDALTAEDGATRELDKAALAARQGTDIPPPGEGNAGAQRGAEVISLGKDTSGAPEEEAADAEEVDGIPS